MEPNQPPPHTPEHLELEEDTVDDGLRAAVAARAEAESARAETLMQLRLRRMTDPHFSAAYTLIRRGMRQADCDERFVEDIALLAAQGCERIFADRPVSG